MLAQPLLHTFKRIQTLRTGRISALPIAILMPHSGCNCRCIMCDIWKGNSNRKQLTEADISSLIPAFKQLGTKHVVLSGGEPLLHERLFDFCSLLRDQGLYITLLSTGISLAQHAHAVVSNVNELIVSLDGDAPTHDRIRNLPGAFAKLKSGIEALRVIKPGFKISSRTVIHRENFHKWLEIVHTGKELGIDRMSFLPADVSSEAFNRQQAWDPDRQGEVLIPAQQLPELREIINDVIEVFAPEIDAGFISESPAKLRMIHQYYAALHGLDSFPFRNCNAPWVSSVIEANGDVRPCFFHNTIGNIRQDGFSEILNSTAAFGFRQQLKKQLHDTCKKCVCSLHLSATENPVNR